MCDVVAVAVRRVAVASVFVVAELSAGLVFGLGRGNVDAVLECAGNLQARHFLAGGGAQFAQPLVQQLLRSAPIGFADAAEHVRAGQPHTLVERPLVASTAGLRTRPRGSGLARRRVARRRSP